MLFLGTALLLLVSPSEGGGLLDGFINPVLKQIKELPSITLDSGSQTKF